MHIEDEKVVALAEAFDGMTSLFLVFVVILPLRAWVFYKGWQWFITPISAVSIGYLQAFGLITLVRFASGGKSARRDKENTMISQTMTTLVYTLTVFGMLFLASSLG